MVAADTVMEGEALLGMLTGVPELEAAGREGLAEEADLRHSLV